MAYSSLTNIWPILVMYAIWLPRAIYKRRLILRPSRDLALAAALAALAVLSTLWSDYPMATLRASFEYASMLACAVIMARVTTVESFVKGLALGATLVLLALFGDGGFSFAGLFGSKNQVGFFAEIGAFAALLYMFTGARLRSKIAFACISAALCMPCLVLSRSATSLASLALTFAAVAALAFTLKFHRRIRPVIAIAALALCAAALFALFYARLDLLLFRAMGKNASLTGRTELWREGIRTALQKPFLGHGYHAFWIVGNPQADLYWYKAHETIGAGFHFHNMFIQAFVDLGLGGALLIALLIATTFYASLRYALKNGMTPTGAACFGFVFMFLLRSFVEVDYLGPFGIGLFIVYSILPRLADEDRRVAARP
ncbi:MAG: O-antigen ligase family protein, partial [Alphaproteobacteria bacterium]|nr:O-antigen ligase family protein [Alphaproteobacteria bacterium]